MPSLIRTARWTGGAYLALALLGGLGFLLVRPLATEALGYAQLGIALELGVVITQSLAAVGFFALYREDRPVAAYAVAAFGMGNALAVLGSAAMLTAALAISLDPATATTPDAAPLLRVVADAFWTVGAVFFGLWLVPMGWFAITTGRMPRILGWILVAGGAGYVVNAVLSAALPGTAGVAADLIVIPATVGELWMVGYLLIRGIRRAPASRPKPLVAPAPAA
ncbi:DUF4386 domain-containing protein [Microbacterium sp. NPDC056057]|uniref:DUF4386 domain-containing protein n=1 Tax=Microbacterium sp. NPDC056057 TaxID=3345699 RepID=UPI0035D79A6A